ncbi:PAS domain S-box protein [Phenylobacterium sp.]|uniref:PAS domain S-box protein n=1 Tax=Phenylobacterium sp. TaxID=1871053 RepID=UPI003983275F
MTDAEAARLATLREYQILDTGPEAVFDRITELAADLFDAPIALVSLVDKDRQWFKSMVGLDVHETPREQAFCAHTILTDEVMVVPDAELDERFRDNPLVLDDPLIRFYAGAPLTMPNGQRLGSLCIIDRNPRPPLTPTERRRLQILAEIVVSEMNLRLTRERLELANKEAETARAAIAEREKMFHELADSAPDMVLKVDQTYTIVYASPSVSQLGYVPEDLVGQPGLSLVHPDDLSRITTQLAGLMQGGEAGAAKERSYRVRTRQGDYAWVEGNPSMLREADGSISGLVTQLRDITLRRAAEEALEASEARYRLLAANSSDVIGCYGKNAIFTFISPAIYRVLGYRPEELVGRHTSEFMHKDDVPHIMRMFRDYMAAGEGAEPIRFEYRAFRKTGEPIWLEGHPRAIYENGTFVEFQDVVRDISLRKANERALAEARDAAEAGAAAKTEFLANMSHELRSPLTSIIGFAGILGASPTLGERERRFTERIGAASNNLLTIVNDVLDLARLDSGELSIKPEATDPREVVAGVLEMLAEQAAAKGLVLTMESKADLPKVLADPARLRQVVLNLVSNAVKFTEKGSITVCLRRQAETLTIAVVDTGIGIAPDRVDQVFERFVQADASITRKFGGTGLGLAISRRLVDRMGGDIEVASKIGEGATFTVRLPLSLQPAALAAEAH